MNISRLDAVKQIEEKIKLFQDILSEKIENYKKKIRGKIRKLEDYKEKIQHFWFNGEIGEDKKVVERALLLMRFYDKEMIYSIGKNLNLQYFEPFKDYREASYHRSALEISQAIKDEDILNIIEENPPEYKLSLGGFQGEYYTATKKGELSVGSSWGNVRKNIQQSLENWDKRAYGVLQAIINKGGTVFDTDINDEIQKILGPGYSWDDLLPRLAQRKLVFEDYYYWEMPPEIIPVVQEELSIYEKSKEIIPIIVQKRREINLIFKQKFKKKLFKEDEIAIVDMERSCENEDDFNNRIQALSTLIDGIDIESLKEYIECKRKGSINILEEFLEKRFQAMIKKLLRSSEILLV
ncbi:MAG: hypothetical protein PVF58_10305 [Candidatus Methanofastidiosia archaeon]